MSRLCLSLLAILALALPARADAGFDNSDPLFQAGETHEVTKVEEAPRTGWAEHVDTVRFGRYSFMVQQRLQPDTGWPVQAGGRWGDFFVRFAGQSSSWSPWSFLTVRVRLAGDAKDLPNVPTAGVLLYNTLREVENERIVAEAAWQDAAGGYLRARFVAWRGVAHAGLTLRYFPPADRQVESLTYSLSCTPYHHGAWGRQERQRWMRTPVRDLLVPPEVTPLDLTQEWAAVFYNRGSYQDAGATWAADPSRLASVTVAFTGEPNASQIPITITPQAPDTEILLLVGDWAGETYAEPSARYLGALPALTAHLADLARLAPKLPTLPHGTQAQLDKILDDTPALAAKFGEQAATNRDECAAALQGLAQEDSPPAFVRWYRARAATLALSQEVLRAYLKDYLTK